MATESKVTTADLLRITTSCNLVFTTWAPGDGMRRYRLHRAGPADYHDGSELFTALGIREAYTWCQGYRAALLQTSRGVPLPVTLTRVVA